MSTPALQKAGGNLFFSIKKIKSIKIPKPNPNLVFNTLTLHGLSVFFLFRLLANHLIWYSNVFLFYRACTLCRYRRKRVPDWRKHFRYQVSKQNELKKKTLVFLLGTLRTLYDFINSSTLKHCLWNSHSWKIALFMQQQLNYLRKLLFVFGN